MKKLISMSVALFVLLGTTVNPSHAFDIVVQLLQSEPIVLSDSQTSQTITYGISNIDSNLSGTAELKIKLSKQAKKFVKISTSKLTFNITNGIFDSPKPVTFMRKKTSAETKSLKISYILSVDLNEGSATTPPFVGDPITLEGSGSSGGGGGKGGLPGCPGQSITRNIKFINNGSTTGRVTIRTAKLSCPDLDSGLIDENSITISSPGVPGNISLPTGQYSFCVEYSAQKGSSTRTFNQSTKKVTVNTADDNTASLEVVITPGKGKGKAGGCPATRDSINGSWTGNATITSGSCDNAQIAFDISNNRIEGEAFTDSGDLFDFSAKVANSGKIQQGSFEIEGRKAFNVKGFIDSAGGVASGTIKSKSPLPKCSGVFNASKTGNSLVMPGIHLKLK